MTSKDTISVEFHELENLSESYKVRFVGRIKDSVSVHFAKVDGVWKDYENILPILSLPEEKVPENVWRLQFEPIKLPYGSDIHVGYEVFSYGELKTQAQNQTNRQ